MAKLFIILGIVFLLLGIIFYLFPNAFSWFGKLPGDIRYEGENTNVYVPIVSMIVISVVLSVVLNLLSR